MPLYESETITRDKLEEIRRKNVCAVCGDWLNTFLDPENRDGIIYTRAFIACHRWLDSHHDGIAKEARLFEENIPTRRERMTTEIGTEKTNQLVKYSATTQLTRPEAMEILEVIWPDAPQSDKIAAAILCSSYGLNPLANHVFLINFKGKWARVWGIKAKRLLASRKGGYSYLDMSPRLMTEAEQIKVWGAVDPDNLCYLTHLKDMKTGAEVYGYGKWPKDQQPYGTEKGNSKANMASIRSESQALDRLRPAEMPSGWIATDEDYIEGEYKAVDTATGEITEQKPEAKPLPDAPETQPEPPKAEEGSKPPSDGIPKTKEELYEWVATAKGWKNSSGAHTFLVNKCKVKEEDIENNPAKVYEEVKALL